MYEPSGKIVDILLVEDNPGDVRLTKEALKESRLHNKLNVVTDGLMAIQYLKKQGEFAKAPRPDMVLLDLNLPKKSGSEVLEEIKNDPDLKMIPVVVLTTSKVEEDIVKSYRLHANCYITKPVDIAQFVKILRVLEDFWFVIVKLPSQK
jgi:CheY-like chemotaxis protein